MRVLNLLTNIVSFVFQVQNQFQEQGLNSMLYYKNREMGETISILPASAIRSEMFLLSPNFSLT